MDPTHNPTLIDYYLSIGPAGKAASLLFLAMMVLAAVLLFRRSGMRCRLALIPLSFVPFLMGIYELASSAATIIRLLQHPPDYSNYIATPEISYHELLYVVQLTTAETIILLVITSVVLMYAPRNEG